MDQKTIPRCAINQPGRSPSMYFVVTVCSAVHVAVTLNSPKFQQFCHITTLRYALSLALNMHANCRFFSVVGLVLYICVSWAIDWVSVRERESFVLFFSLFYSLVWFISFSYWLLHHIISKSKVVLGHGILYSTPTFFLLTLSLSFSFELSFLFTSILIADYCPPLPFSNQKSWLLKWEEKGPALDTFHLLLGKSFSPRFIFVGSWCIWFRY